MKEKEQRAFEALLKLEHHARGFINYKDSKIFYDIIKDIKAYINDLENKKGSDNV